MSEGIIDDFERALEEALKKRDAHWDVWGEVCDCRTRPEAHPGWCCYCDRARDDHPNVGLCGTAPERDGAEWVRHSLTQWVVYDGPDERLMEDGPWRT